MKKSIKDSFSGFGIEVIEGIRERNHEMIDEYIFEERMLGIEKAILAFNESGIEEEEVINLLQKYWDLRRSEAKELIRTIIDGGNK